MKCQPTNYYVSCKLRDVFEGFACRQVNKKGNGESPKSRSSSEPHAGGELTNRRWLS